MDCNQILNLIGLLLMTIGSIFAALCTPAPKYNSDGSVSLCSEQDKIKRIRIHRRQKFFPRFLILIGLGALIQAVAVICP